MKKIAVVQLNRLGDIIQTLNSLQGIEEKHDVEVTLIGRKSFLAPLETIAKQFVSKVSFVDLENLAENDLGSMLSNVNDYIASLNEVKFDLVINLTFDKTSSYLTKLINAPHKVGITRNTQNQVVVNGQWSQYVYSNIMGSDYSCFNLVDIFKNIIGMEGDPPTADFNRESNKIFIHPFASDEKKQWQTSKWVEVIYSLKKKHKDAIIYIVGSKQDTPKAELILSSPILSAYKDDIQVWVGNKSIVELNTEIQDAKLFIGNDSMVSHLAALYRVPTLVVSLGPVRPFETTPYLEGALSVAANIDCFPCAIDKKCDLLPCHNKISHEAVSHLASSIYENNTIDANSLESKLPQTLLNTVTINRLNNTNDGLLPEDLLASATNFDDTIRRIYRIVWSFYLQGKEPKLQTPYINANLAQSFANTLSGLNHLYELYNFAIKFANRIVEEEGSTNIDVKSIQESVHKLNEIDQLLMKTKNTFAEVSPIVDYFHVAKSNIDGNNIFEISRNTLVLFYEAANITAAMFDLCSKIISPYTQETEVKGTAHDI
jgi:ADP-heptose:LPS heptosyltransferase